MEGIQTKLCWDVFCKFVHSQLLFISCLVLKYNNFCKFVIIPFGRRFHFFSRFNQFLHTINVHQTITGQSIGNNGDLYICWLILTFFTYALILWTVFFPFCPNFSVYLYIRFEILWFNCSLRGLGLIKKSARKERNI